MKGEGFSEYNRKDPYITMDNEVMTPDEEVVEAEDTAAEVAAAPVAAPAKTAAAPAARSNNTANRGKRRKVCQFCADKIDHIDYKDISRLRKCISERSKILPRRVSGTCAKHQRQVTVAVKRARTVALLAYISD